MKRTIPVILSLLFAVLLTACTLPELPWPSRAADPETDETSFSVYRLTAGEANAGSLIAPEAFPPPAADGTELDTASALFASQPADPSLSCALPPDVTLLSAVCENGVATITLSETYLDLPEITRTSIAFCAVLTFCQLDGVEAVTVVSGGEAVYTGLMPEDAFLTAEPGDPYIRRLRLYFSDGNGRYLLSEYHSLTLEEDASAERYVVEELLRGPNNGELKSAIPAGTRLLSCSTAGGVCTVDLSSAFLDDRPDTALGERLAVYSLVDSLTALSQVGSVRILVEGEPVGTYVRVSLAEPVARYEEPIGPVSVPGGEFDADLYLVAPDMTTLEPLPFRIGGAGYETQAEAVLARLLSAAEPGYPSVFPASTSVTGLTLSGTRCTLELSESFLSSIPEDDRAVVLGSVIETLCALPGISSVRFEIAGGPAVFGGTDWTGSWQSAEDIMQIKEGD